MQAFELIAIHGWRHVDVAALDAHRAGFAIQLAPNEIAVTRPLGWVVPVLRIGPAVRYVPIPAQPDGDPRMPLRVAGPVMITKSKFLVSPAFSGARVPPAAG